MSQELEFVNFTISFNTRLSQIVDKCFKPKKSLETLSEEEMELLHAMHVIFEDNRISFGNDNRDASEIIIRDK